MVNAVASQSHPENQSQIANSAPIVARATSLAQKPAEPQSPSNAAKDTVHISNAAQLLLRESLETPAQTAREANGGDRQAQRLLAKEAAAKLAE